MPFPESNIFSVNEASFGRVALSVFKYQYEHQSTYRAYCDALKRTPENVFSENQIPFLPIQFFKSRQIISEEFEAEEVFESSGTSGMSVAQHPIASLSTYEKSFFQTFHQFYGPPSEYCILALLPSYLEKGNSSLVYMVDRLMRESNHPENGFYMNDFEQLQARLASLEFRQEKVLLIGVTYALLDFAEQFPMQLKNTVVMETGGMKGRRKEMLRTEVHKELKKAFGLKNIQSEYGMTELLTQAYAHNDGFFRSPKWMRVKARDPYNPLQIIEKGKTGALNIIDLANVYSCSFIASDDIGIVHADNSFEVLGRRENTDVRGCSLLYGVEG